MQRPVMLFLAIGVFFHSDLTPCPATDQPPHIVLIMADDLGWGDPSYQPGGAVPTPHLDQLAKDGARFDRFYAAAPVCSPTRGSCLTGRHPFRYGIYFANTGRLPDAEVTLAEILAEHGYATGHFGKWHLGTLTTERRDSNRGREGNHADYAPPWRHGFDACFSTEAKVPTWDPLLKPRGDVGKQWWLPVGDASDGEAYGTAYWTREGLVGDELRGDDSAIIVERAIEFMEPIVQQGEQPVFVVIWFHAPHLPVVSGESFRKPFAEMGGYQASYFGCIAAMDEAIGSLRSKFDEWGIGDDTLIAFCSDNGPEGNDRAPGAAGGLRGRKRSLYEGGIRVPGLITYPRRIEPGSVIQAPAVTSDYLPTVLAAAGVVVENDRPIDGVSLWPMIDDPERPRHRAICFESAGQLAIMNDRFKLVRPAQPRGSQRLSPDDETPPIEQFALYDLTADREESTDIRSQHREVAAELWQELDQWRASCRDSRAGADY